MAFRGLPTYNSAVQHFPTSSPTCIGFRTSPFYPQQNPLPAQASFSQQSQPSQGFPSGFSSTTQSSFSSFPSSYQQSLPPSTRLSFPPPLFSSSCPPPNSLGLMTGPPPPPPPPMYIPPSSILQSQSSLTFPPSMMPPLPPVVQLPPRVVHSPPSVPQPQQTTAAAVPTATTKSPPSKPPVQRDEWDVDAIIAETTSPKSTAKTTTYRLKWQQERERRDGLLAQAEATLLDKREWAEREYLVEHLHLQQQQDINEREALLNDIAKHEAPIIKLKQLLQTAKDREEEQCSMLRERDQEIRNLRPLITEKENQLIDDETQFTDQIEELNNNIETLHKMEADLNAHLESIAHQSFAQSDRYKQVTNQLILATREMERLSERIPSQYQVSPMACIESAHDVPAVDDEIASRQLALADDFESDDGELQSQGSQNVIQPADNIRGKPLVGMEVRAENDLVRVVSMSSGGAAASAGFRVGDVIRTWNGRPITSKLSYSKAVVSSGVGNAVKVEISRSRGAGRYDSVVLTVTAKPTSRAKQGHAM